MKLADLNIAIVLGPVLTNQAVSESVSGLWVSVQTAQAAAERAIVEALRAAGVEVDA